MAIKDLSGNKPNRFNNEKSAGSPHTEPTIGNRVVAAIKKLSPLNLFRSDKKQRNSNHVYTSGLVLYRKGVSGDGMGQKTTGSTGPMLNDVVSGDFIANEFEVSIDGKRMNVAEYCQGLNDEGKETLWKSFLLASNGMVKKDQSYQDTYLHNLKDCLGAKWVSDKLGKEIEIWDGGLIEDLSGLQESKSTFETYDDLFVSFTAMSSQDFKQMINDWDEDNKEDLVSFLKSDGKQDERIAALAKGDQEIKAMLLEMIQSTDVSESDNEELSAEALGAFQELYNDLIEHNDVNKIKGIRKWTADDREPFILFLKSDGKQDERIAALAKGDQEIKAMLLEMVNGEDNGSEDQMPAEKPMKAPDVVSQEIDNTRGDYVLAPQLTATHPAEQSITDPELKALWDELKRLPAGDQIGVLNKASHGQKQKLKDFLDGQDITVKKDLIDLLAKDTTAADRQIRLRLENLEQEMKLTSLEIKDMSNSITEEGVKKFLIDKKKLNP